MKFVSLSFGLLLFALFFGCQSKESKSYDSCIVNAKDKDKEYNVYTSCGTLIIPSNAKQYGHDRRAMFNSISIGKTYAFEVIHENGFVPMIIKFREE